jgi:uncharacterized RDD family membrane protein YckC
LQTIEINTAQNVRIGYELASVGLRIFAYLIDFFVMALGMLLFVSAVPETEDDLLIRIFAFFWLGFYTLTGEMLGNGQTIGKKAMGIKVIKLNGDVPDFYDYFSRWSMRMVDIYLSVGSIAVLLIASNRNGQRIGDVIAGTCIIRMRGNTRFQLNDILKLNRKSEATNTFQYPMAGKLSEEDVILIKQTLHRKRLFNNHAHQQAIEHLAEKLKVLFELERLPEDREDFLNRVVSEYIILTR